MELDPVGPLSSWVSHRVQWLAWYCFSFTSMTLPQASTHRWDFSLMSDDGIIYREIHDNNDHTLLHEDISKLQSWSECWQMTFKPEKCFVLTITNKHSPSQFGYHINNVRLEKKDPWKYLCIIIDSKLNWNKHCTEISRKARQALGLIQRTLHAASPECKAIAYKALKPSTPGVRFHSLECPDHQTHQTSRKHPEQRCKICLSAIWLDNKCHGPQTRPPLAHSPTKTQHTWLNHVVQNPIRHSKYQFSIHHRIASMRLQRPNLPWAVLYLGPIQSGMLRTVFLCANHPTLEHPMSPASATFLESFQRLAASHLGSHQP